MKKRWIGYGAAFVLIAALVIPAWAGDSIRNADAWLRPTYRTMTDGDTTTTTTNTTNTTNTTTTTNTATDIGAEQAKQIALHHAGLAAQNVQWLDVDTDWEENGKVYELTFCDSMAEYEYEIDALHGTICKSEMAHHRTAVQSSAHHAAHHDTAQNTADIGAEQAKQIALYHAGVTAAEAQNLQLEADWEDGSKVYEVEFRVGMTEYEYEILAADGTIWKVEVDWK